MGDYWRDAENMIQAGRIKVPYTWQAGETASHYFIQLRDATKIVGKHCPKCDKVLVPPRKICPFCTVPTDRWVELSGQGTVHTAGRTKIHDVSTLIPRSGTQVQQKIAFTNNFRVMFHHDDRIRQVAQPF